MVYRFRDPELVKLHRQYKWFNRVVPIQQLITSNPLSPSISLHFLNRLAPNLHLHDGAETFLRHFPHIFTVFHHTHQNHLHCSLTETALSLWNQEAKAVRDALPVAVERLVRVVSMSVTKCLPVSVVDEVCRELGLPEDYEVSVILRNPDVFRLDRGMLELVRGVRSGSLVASVEDWRVVRYCDGDGDGVGGGDGDSNVIRYCFKQCFPEWVKWTEGYRNKVKEWQRLAYVGPYEDRGAGVGAWAGKEEMEKRAVGIVHEFLSLTVEKMVEVERISSFREWFGIDFDMRGLFMGHPGIFYLSTKGCRHVVFLREAYERGRLIDTNPVYEVRRKLLDLVLLGIDVIDSNAKSSSGVMMELEEGESIANESKLEELESY